MLIESKKIKEKRRKPLNLLAFVKFIAMIKIIKWHIFHWTKRPIDYGARMCEILFISSGFLIGYNYYKMYFPSIYIQSVKYAYKHLKNFYPLLFLITLYNFYFSRLKKINIIAIEALLSNLLMLQSWSRYRYIIAGFNGIAWFLSALLFCYFLSPILINGINSIKRSLILFIFIALLRISIEELVMNGKFNPFDANFHTGPIIRFLEFFLGMLLSPLFFVLKFYFDKYQKIKGFKICFTLSQIFLSFSIYYIMLKYNNILYRCYFVIIFNVFILFFGLDYGYLSDILTNRLCQTIMSCQMEMYLIQNVINGIITNQIKFHIKMNEELRFLLKLLIIFLVGYSYKIILKERLAKILDKIIYYLLSFL